jgi:hypothetical protein
MGGQREATPSARSGRWTWPWLLIGLAILMPRPVDASVVSPLGAIFFHDPLSFDAGVLQRGGSLRTGLGSEGFSLDAAVDLPMFHELSLRIGYAQRLAAETAGGHDLTWRVRMPILERARYGRLGTVQIDYAGHHPFARPDARAPRHELTGAYSGSFARSGPGITLHGQIGLVARRSAEVDAPLTLGRFGVVARGAFLTQLYRPRFGSAWSTTLSVAEATAVHYGLPGDHAGDGRISLAVAAPAVHFTPRSATYSLGLLPRGTWTYGATGGRLDWGAHLVLAATYRTHTE